MRLNLGCGQFPIAGHINIDSQLHTGVDAVLRTPPLPYADSAVESIYAGHFLEHLPPWDVLPLLRECYRILTSSGTLTLITPDERKARLGLQSQILNLAQYVEIAGGALDIPQPLSAELYAQIIGGEQEDDMPHWTLWNTKRLRLALERAGFAVDEGYDWHTDERVHDRTAFWQCGARGVKR